MAEQFVVATGAAIGGAVNGFREVSAGAALASAAFTCFKVINGIVTFGGTTHQIAHGLMRFVRKVTTRKGRTKEYISLLEEDLQRAGDGQWIFVDKVKRWKWASQRREKMF